MCLSSPIMNDIFSLSENNSYNRRSGVTVNRRNIRTSKIGFETVSTIGVILQNDLPAELENAESLKVFQQQISNLEVDGCPSKENLFGQAALLMSATYVFFPKVIYKFME